MFLIAGKKETATQCIKRKRGKRERKARTTWDSKAERNRGTKKVKYEETNLTSSSRKSGFLIS